MGNPGQLLSFWVFSWKEKSVFLPLRYFFYSTLDNPSQKMTEDLKDIIWVDAYKLLHIGNRKPVYYQNM